MEKQLVSLDEIAKRDTEVYNCLISFYGHTATANEINDLGYSTTESSVRRWRKANCHQYSQSAQDEAEAKGTSLLTTYSPRHSRPLEAISAPSEAPNVLIIDIEVAPMIVWCWDLWNPKLSPDSVMKEKEILCFAAKWLGKDEIIFRSKDKSLTQMIDELHYLLNKADIVIHYNGVKFDIPHINTLFLTHGLNSPSSFKQIDLLKVVRKQFKFSSNSLNFVCRELGLAVKKNHGGSDTWLKCMDGDPEAWKTMQKYNENDVVITEELYKYLLPWIPDHPNVGLFNASAKVESCPTCGHAEALIQSGYYFTSVSRYPKYVCGFCGSWSRENSKDMGTTLKGI